MVVFEYFPSRLAGQRSVRLTGRPLVRFPDAQIDRVRIGRDDLVVQNIASVAFGRAGSVDARSFFAPLRKKTGRLEAIEWAIV